MPASEDAVVAGLMDLKALGEEAREEFGEAKGRKLVALAMKVGSDPEYKEAGGTIREAYGDLAMEYRRALAGEPGDEEMAQGLTKFLDSTRSKFEKVVEVKVDEDGRY